MIFEDTLNFRVVAGALGARLLDAKLAYDTF
jgi:hypothetical protein